MHKYVICLLHFNSLRPSAGNENSSFENCEFEEWFLSSSFSHSLSLAQRLQNQRKMVSNIHVKKLQKLSEIAVRKCSILVWHFVPERKKIENPQTEENSKKNAFS